METNENIKMIKSLVNLHKVGLITNQQLHRALKEFANSYDFKSVERLIELNS